MQQRGRTGLAWGTLAALALAFAPTAAMAEPAPSDDFVRTDGTEFTLGGEEFHVLGSNNYYPMYSSE